MLYIYHYVLYANNTILRILFNFFSFRWNKPYQRYFILLRLLLLPVTIIYYFFIKIIFIVYVLCCYNMCIVIDNRIVSLGYKIPLHTLLLKYLSRNNTILVNKLLYLRIAKISKMNF